MSGDGSTIRYMVVLSNPAEADRDSAFQFVLRLTGPDAAKHWLDALLVTLESIPSFPRPRSHALEEKASDYYSRPVRRALFYGTGTRRNRTPYRILFTVLEPSTPDEEGTVLILRILHGAQQFPPIQTETNA